MSPQAGGQRPAGCVQTAEYVFAGDQNSVASHRPISGLCEAGRWMIRHGFGQRCIFGHVASSPGSCCQRAIRFSKQALSSSQRSNCLLRNQNIQHLNVWPSMPVDLSGFSWGRNAACVACWHETDVPHSVGDVRYSGQTGSGGVTL